VDRPGGPRAAHPAARPGPAAGRRSGAGHPWPLPDLPHEGLGEEPHGGGRGRLYRVCCLDCGKDLQKNPDKCLEKDGTPKNAKPK